VSEDSKFLIFSSHSELRFLWVAPYTAYTFISKHPTVSVEWRLLLN